MSSLESSPPDRPELTEVLRETAGIEAYDTEHHGVHAFSDSAFSGSKSAIFGLTAVTLGLESAHLYRYSGMALLATGTVASTYALRLSLMAKRTERSRELVQSYFDEPIDANESGVSWYGFDRNYHGPDFQPADNIPEFATLVDAERPDSRRAIQVSAAVLDVLPDSSAYNDLKRHSHPAGSRVIDLKSDETILRLPHARAVQLKNDLIAAREGYNLRRAITLLGKIEAEHPATSVFERDGFSQLTALENLLRMRIEDKASHTALLNVEDQQIFTGVRKKGFKQATVQGRNILFFSETPNQDNTRISRNFGGTQQIGNGKQYEQLFAEAESKIENGSKPVEQVEQIAWLALQDYKQQRYTTRNKDKALYDSVGKRMETETPRAFPMLRRFGQGADADSATLLYRSPYRKKYAASAAGAVLLASTLWGGVHHFTGGGDLGTGSGELSGSDMLSSDGAGVFGDVPGDGKGGNTASWHLSVPQGVDATGYWPDRNDNALVLYPAGDEIATPPFKDASLVSLPVEVKAARTHMVEQQRPGQDAITVTGKVWFPQETLETNSDNYDDTYIIPIPVQNGSSVTSAEAIGTDQLEKTGEYQPTDLIQLDDGSYFIEVAGSRKQYDGDSIKVRYTVERTSAEGRYMVANHRTKFAAQFYSNTYRPLRKIISQQDAQDVADAMPGTPPSSTSDPEEVAGAVKASHDYSNTPYKLAGVRSELYAFSDRIKKPAVEPLKLISMQAAEIKYALCNTAALSTLVITRGMDEAGAPVQLTSGYYNNGDDLLTTSEQHMWLTDSHRRTIDPTPGGYADVPLTAEQKRDRLKDMAITTGEAALAASALIGIGYVGRRKYRSDKLSSIARSLSPEEPEDQAKLNETLARYKWLLYASPRPYSAEQLARVGQSWSARTFEQKISALPDLPPRKIRRKAAGRRSEGSPVTRDQVRAISAVARQVRYQRKHRDR